MASIADLISNLKKKLKDGYNGVADALPIVPNTSQIKSFASNPVQFMSNPSYNGGNNLYRTTPFKIGAQVQNFIESPKRTYDLIPEIKVDMGAKTPTANMVQGATNFALNLPINMAKYIGSNVIDTATDAGANIGRTITGRPLMGYEQVKSPVTRLGYQAAQGLLKLKAPTDTKLNAKEVIGNLGEEANVLLDASAGNFAKSLAKNAVKQGGKRVVLDAIKRGAIEGGTMGGVMGLTQGLGENRKTSNNLDYARNVLTSLAGGALAGTTFGATIGGGSAYWNKLVNRVQKINPNLTKDQATSVARSFVRDELGRFTGVRKPKTEPLFYGDIREAYGLPRNGDYQSGFIDLNAKIGGEETPPGRIQNSLIEEAKKYKSEEVILSDNAKMAMSIESGGYRVPKNAEIKLGQSGVSVSYKGRGVVNFWIGKDGKIDVSTDNLGNTSPDFIKDAWSKSKSQLTDIWNQANKGVENPITKLESQLHPDDVKTLKVDKEIEGWSDKQYKSILEDKIQELNDFKSGQMSKDASYVDLQSSINELRKTAKEIGKPELSKMVELEAGKISDPEQARQYIMNGLRGIRDQKFANKVKFSPTEMTREENVARNMLKKGEITPQEYGQLVEKNPGKIKPLQLENGKVPLVRNMTQDQIVDQARQKRVLQEYAAELQGVVDVQKAQNKAVAQASASTLELTPKDRQMFARVKNIIGNAEQKGMWDVESVKTDENKKLINTALERWKELHYGTKDSLTDDELMTELADFVKQPLSKRVRAETPEMQGALDSIMADVRNNPYTEERFPTSNSKPANPLDLQKDQDLYYAKKYKAQNATPDALERIMNTPIGEETGKLYPDNYWKDMALQRKEAKVQATNKIVQAQERAKILEGKPVDTPQVKQEVSQAAKEFADAIENGTVPKPVDKKGLMGQFADWVNARRARHIEGTLVARDLEEFRKDGVKGLIEMQSGVNPQKYDKVRKITDELYRNEKAAGYDMGYQMNYTPQMWDNTQEEINQVFKDKIAKTPGFTLEKMIKDIQTGLDANLKLRYDNIPDLISARVKQSEKAIADKKFYDFLFNSGLLLPDGKAPRDWKPIPTDRMRGLKYFDPDTGIEYTKSFYAPERVQSLISNYFGDNVDPNLEKAADYVSKVKNMASSFGVPGTAINAQGFNVAARNVLSSDKPVQDLLKTVYYMVNTGAAEKNFQANLKDVPFAVKHGLTLSTNEYKTKIEAPADVKGKFSDAWNKLFERGIFDRMIPALKLSRFKQVYEANLKQGMPEYDAARSAAKFTNDAFGGINIEEMGRNKNMQNLMRTIFFAPDWMESNLRLGGNITKSLLNPTTKAGQAYRRFAIGTVGAYAGANMLNYAASGHFMWDNEPGHTFELDTGTYTDEGQKRYVRWGGTALDFVRLPMDVVLGIAKGDFTVPGRIIRNRLSGPAQAAASLAFNVDAFGNPVYGKNKYGKDIEPLQQAVNVGSQLGNAAGLPWFAQEFLKGATGQQGIEQSLTQGFEMPLRYSPTGKSTLQQQVKEISQVKGKDLYDQNQRLKGESKLSDKQFKAVKSGGMVKLDAILAKRETTANDNKIKKELEDGTAKDKVVGNKYYYLDKEGSAKVIDLSFTPKYPELTGSTELDKKLISKYRGEITKKANDIEALYTNGVISAKDAESALQKLNEMKIATNKGKTIKIGKVPKIKAPKIKLARVKNVKIKIPKLKLARAKAVKLKLTKPKNTKIKMSLGGSKA